MRYYSVEIDPLETLKIRYAMVLRDNKKLQAEVERLTEINQGRESEARLYDDLLYHCRVENARLRKVVDAARVLWWGADINQWKTFDQAIAELDEEKQK